MPDLIFLRLHPSEPIPAGDFTKLLQKLTITAFDLSFDDPKSGVELGHAQGLASPPIPPNNGFDPLQAHILQHYIDLSATSRQLESVATAIIEVQALPGPEYPTPQSYDLRLEIKRDGLPIANHQLEFNVAVDSGPLVADQKICFNKPASAYVALPAHGAAQEPSTATVDLPVDATRRRSTTSVRRSTRCSRRIRARDRSSPRARR